MAHTPKIKRRWIKEEKQIVYLLYRKGLMNGRWKIKDLYWAEYHWYNRKSFKTKHNLYDGRKYRHPVYMPEVHFCTSDYWGESDEHSIVSSVLQQLHWENIDTKNWDEDSGEYPKSKFPRMTRNQFIKYLKGLPTKVADKKINTILKRTNIYD